MATLLVMGWCPGYGPPEPAVALSAAGLHGAGDLPANGPDGRPTQPLMVAQGYRGFYFFAT